MKDTYGEGTSFKRFSANLPAEYINGLDELKKEWGLRSRGAVLERLLEELFTEEKKQDEITNDSQTEIDNSSENLTVEKKIYNDNTALVLITNNEIEKTTSNVAEKRTKAEEKKSKVVSKVTNSSVVIDLPGFVSSKTKTLRESLGKVNHTNQEDSVLNTVKESEVTAAIKASRDHWTSLYGNEPGENVVEAAMLWLARDIWPQIEGSDERPFTWTAASKLLSQYCPSWISVSIKFENIIVMAGVLEDPFSSSNLHKRIPTLIRRFVNQYRRRNKVTSFQTIESTMTVHGALKLLGLPTQAGSALTLKSIKEAYKSKAMENHPDAGGSTETMRKLNEGYQLLKDLYKNK